MPSNKDKIVSSFNTFFEGNETYTRKELLEFAKKTYDENYKKTKKVVDENAVKKPLNSYQLFMKEQRAILNKRENERTDGEKKKSTELMKEIAEMWKNQKNNIEKKEEDNNDKEEVKVEDVNSDKEEVKVEDVNSDKEEVNSSKDKSKKGSTPRKPLGLKK
jgi:tRNA A37 N6-isopentenylltransferase MiaA